MTSANFRSLLMSGVVRRLVGAAVLVGLLWLAVTWAIGEPSSLTLQ
jgi:phosphate/sulfate permease